MYHPCVTFLRFLMLKIHLPKLCHPYPHFVSANTSLKYILQWWEAQLLVNHKPLLFQISFNQVDNISQRLQLVPDLCTESVIDEHSMGNVLSHEGHVMTIQVGDGSSGNLPIIGGGGLSWKTCYNCFRC